MRLAMDIRKYQDYGIGTYIRNLVSMFGRTPEIDGVYLAGADTITNEHVNIAGTIIQDDSPKYSIRELFSISAKANASAADLFHAPHYTLPVGLRMPSVVTVHDIIHLRMKQYYGIPQRSYASLMVRHACRNSSAVIAVSQFAKDELIETFGITPEKVRVVHHGVEPRFFEPIVSERLQQFREQYGIGAPFILYTGSVKPHKNIGALLEAMRIVTTKNDILLVCAGESLNDAPELQERIRASGLQHKVLSLGRLDEATLHCAYQSAAAVVLPSFYEGFGFSMLEAMASGVPAIGANAASIPEVMGDAGLLFDPYRPEELAHQIDRVLNDSALRTSLVQNGNDRVAGFRWETCAARTINVYREVLP